DAAFRPQLGVHKFAIASARDSGRGPGRSPLFRGSRVAKRAKPKSKAKPRSGRASGVLGRGFRTVLVLVLIFGLIGPVAVATLCRFVPPPMTFLMVQRLFEGRGFDRRWVPLRKISPRLVGAVIASEDSGFCEHHGFDVAAIQKALKHNAADPNRIRGG